MEKQRGKEKILECIKKYLEMDCRSVDYSMIACDARDLMEADYAILHLKDASGWYVTQGVAAAENQLNTVSRVLGESLIGRRWYMDEEQTEFLIHQPMAPIPLRKEHNNCLVPGATARHLLNLFRIKRFYMVPVLYNKDLKGFIVLLSRQAEFAPDRSMAEFFSYVLGTANARWDSERLVEITEESRNLVFENMTGFVGKISPEGVWTYVSPSMRRIIGLEGRYFIGTSCLERIHPDDQSIIHPLLTNQESFVHRVNFTVRMKHRDGHYINLAVNARGIRSDAGEFLGAAVEGRDTGKSDHDFPGAESDQNLDLAELHGKVSGVWEWSLDDDQLFFGQDSAKWFRSLGKPSAGLKDWLIAVHPDDRKGMLGSLQALIKGEKNHEDRTYRMAADGQWVTIHTHSTAMKDSSTGFIRSIVHLFSGAVSAAGQSEADQGNTNVQPQIKESSADDRERIVQLMHELEQSEMRYKCLADASFEAIIVSENVNGKWNYSDVNKATETLFGYSREELLSEDRELLFSQISEEEVLGKVNTGYTGIYYAEGRHKCGRLFPVAIRGKNYQEGGRVFRIGIIRDLTEEKKKEIELKQTEAKMHGLVASLPDAVFRYDCNASLVYINPAAAEIMGTTEDQIMGHSNVSIHNTDLQDEWKKIVRQVLANAQKMELEAVIETAKGPMNVHVFFIPECNIMDEVTSVMCVVHDVTAQKAIEAKLKYLNDAYVQLNAELMTMNEELISSNEELTAMEEELKDQLAIIQRNENVLKRWAEEWRALAENSPDIIARYDKNKKRVFINSTVEREMGIPVHELLGKHIHAGGLQKHVVSVLNDKIDEVFVTKTAQENFMEISTHIGMKYFHSRFVPEFGPDGEVEYVLNVTRNLTEQKQAEDQVRQSEARYRFFVSSFHGIAYRGDFSYRPYFFGGDVEAITGYQSDEFMAQTVKWRELVHPEDQALFYAHSEALEHQPGKTFTRIYRIIRKDGQERWISQFIQSTTDHEGLVNGVQGAIYDVTDQIISQEKLAEAQQLLMTVLDSMDAFVYAVDFSTDEVLYINQYGRNLWGDVVGKKCYEFKKNEQKTKCDHCVTERLLDDQGQPTGVASWEYYLEKNQRWFSSRSNVVRWVDGRMVRIEIATDHSERKQFEKELQASEERYRSLIENINDMVYELDREGTFKYVSPVCQRVLGYAPEEIIGKSYEELIHPEDLPALRESFERTLQGITEVSEFRISTKLGLWKYARSSSQQQWEEGEVIGLVGVLADISETKEAEAALRDSEKRFRMLAENALDVVFRVDLIPAAHFTYISPSITKVSGYEPNDFYNKIDLFEKIMDTHERTRLVEILADDQDKIQRPLELILLHATGEKVWMETVINPVANREGKIVAYEGIARDITRRKKAENEIHHLTFHDILTGLYNRAYYEQELRRLDVGRQMPLSVIMCDLNGLKLINDSLGHHAGDQTLQKTAEMLRKSCRQEDVICRWGGDEFAVLLPKTDSETVAEICSRIQKHCEEANTELEIPVSLSLGYATKTDASMVIEDILKEAEDRMYRKKLLESKSTRSSIIASLLGSLESKTKETWDHTERLRQDSLLLGSAMALSAPELDKLVLLSAMHDIGKISIPDDILTKAAPLDENEWQIVKNHCEYGFRIAQSAPDLAHIADEILSHHEWWDGNGYPQGLNGEDIPVISRILSVVDAYDVMIHGRPYKKKMTALCAAQELVKKSGSQFDPAIVRIFVSEILGMENLFGNMD
jgi:diguanylate cyclase (GGDEF)-like protein/PAS domain S-box-containing protein